MTIRSASVATFVLSTFSFLPASASPAEALAQKIVDRPTNEGRIGEMHFSLTDKNGRERKREAMMVHSDEKDAVKIAIYFTAPGPIANTAFLSHDNAQGDDETWLFLPSTDRVRRLPSSDRSDSFMGTDLSYGDVKDNFKFQLDDWTFSGGELTTDSGFIILNGVAMADAAKETGYSTFSALIDPNTLFPIEVVYNDVDGQPMKKVTVLEQENIEGAWTAMHFRAENLQSGHQTDIRLENVRYEPGLDADYLVPDYLDEGAPD